MNIRIYIYILLFIPFCIFSQTQECGTVPTQAQIDYLIQTQSNSENWDQSETIIYLPVQHHIVRQTNGSGGLNPSDIPLIMSIMNTYYANANISFFDCGTINYIDNSNYYNFSSSDESTLCGANDVSDVINIYYFNSVTSSGGSSLCGYAYFPGGSWKNRIIMNNSCALNGSTLTHELGHYLSLYHTHQGSTGSNPELVNGSNCTTAGDQLCDTPADPTLSNSTVNTSCSYTGTATDPNGQLYVPDPTNIMSYSRKSCRNFLSTDQYNRANYSAINDRGYLNCSSSIYGCTDPNALNHNSNATIDDGSCTYCNSVLPYSENFDISMGSWNNTGSSGNWVLNSGGTPSNNTGPNDDVTGGGSYMYIEASSPNYPNIGPFILTSECFDLSNSTSLSLSFYYNMYGSGMGTLNVYANSNVIWTLSGNQGQGWNLVQIPLTAVGNTLIIEFEGTTGSSYTSDIAIDNIDIISVQQISGCTDPVAINYNANATIDDGSCIYPLSVSLNSINISCNGGNDGSCVVSVSGGQAPYTYLWNTGQTSSSLNNLSAGTYTINVSDASGQTQTNTIIITEPSLLLLSFVVTNESFLGSNDGAIDMTVSGGISPYLYYWSTTPSQTTEDINNLSAGDYVVYVGFNNWICAISDTVTVNVEVYGCTDSNSCNYNSLATVDDGSCIVLLYGCTDINAINYVVPTGTCSMIDNGSCLYIGCNDPIATNYAANNIGCDSLGSNACCTYSASCGEITGIYVDNIIHKRAIFNWDNMNSSSCSVDQIRIRYRPIGTSLWLTKTMGAPVGGGCNIFNTNKLVRFLIPSTQYEYDFKVWYCNTSTVSWHGNGTFTTLPNCDNAINMTATPLNNITKVLFCWDTVSVYSFVRLKYREDVPGSSFINVGGFGVFSPTLCKEKGGVTPGLQYRVKWKTYCSPSGGPYRGSQWDGPVLWTQPSSIRVTGGTAISNLDVYPNPSRDIFNVNFTSDDIQNLDIRIVNLIGEVVYTENLEQFVGQYTKQVDLTTYTKGIYFLEITTDNGVVNKKLILQ